MSQQQNQTSQTLYPVLGNSYAFQQQQGNQTQLNDKQNSSQPAQPTYVQPVVLLQPINANPQHDMKQPLLNSQPISYPVYHPKGMVGYARKSRRNCCCILCCITCSFFFFILALAGIAVGLVAWKCMQMSNSTTQVFTVDPSNATALQLNAQQGTIYVSQSTDVTITNVTVTITRRASDDDLFQTFSSSLVNSDGQIVFTDESTTNNWWDAVGQICIRVEINVVLPANFNGVSQFVLSTDNGDVNMASIVHQLNQFTVSTTNGNINVSGIASSDISLRTTNGNVFADNCTATTMIMSTTNGDVKIGSVSIATSLSGSSSNGDIHVEDNVQCTSATEDISFGTTNGNLELAFNNCQTNFNFGTSNGDISVESNGATLHYNSQSDHQTSGYVGAPNSNSNVRGTSTNGDITVVFN